MSSTTMKAIDLLTLGETMLRLSPTGNGRLESAHRLDMHPGGAESNVAVGLARLGKRTVWWSRLPDSPLGRYVAAAIQAHGVDTTGIHWSDGRLGTYFVEFGNAPRRTHVIYDRANSAASQMTPEDFPWTQLRAVKWVHLTGITPALSSGCLNTIERAIAEARRADARVSLDLNYRAKLWSAEKAAPTLDALAEQCDVVIVAERDVHTLFRLSENVLANLHQRWKGATVVMTQGAQGARAFDGIQERQAAAFPVAHPISIGAGDAFVVGLLCALLEERPLGEALMYGNAVAALKLTMPGDFAIVTRQEVEDILRGPVTGILR